MTWEGDRQWVSEEKNGGGRDQCGQRQLQNLCVGATIVSLSASHYHPWQLQSWQVSEVKVDCVDLDIKNIREVVSGLSQALPR